MTPAQETEAERVTNDIHKEIIARCGHLDLVVYKQILDNVIEELTRCRAAVVDELAKGGV